MQINIRNNLANSEKQTKISIYFTSIILDYINVINYIIQIC